MTDPKISPALVEAGDAGRLEQAERDKFEKWAGRHFLRIPVGISPLERDDGGRYVASQVQVAWLSWEIRAEAASQECAGLRAELEAAKKRISDLERVLPDVLYAGTLPYRVQGGTREWDKVEAAARKLLKGA